MAGIRVWLGNNVFNPARWAHWNNLTTALASLVVIIGGLGGLLLKGSHDEKDALDTKIASQRSEISDLNETIGNLEAQAATDKGTIDGIRQINSDLQRRVLELERQVEPIPEQVDAPAVRKAQTLTLAIDGQAIDLNSTEVNFDAGPDGQYDTDFAFVVGGFTGPATLHVGDGDFARVQDPPARYENCSLATNYDVDENSIPLRDLRDDVICIRLETGRVATVLVKDFNDQEATLRVTVWENP